MSLTKKLLIATSAVAVSLFLVGYATIYGVVDNPTLGDHHV